eukprot:1154289-Pelagomonas_calceolata.AAC.2
MGPSSSIQACECASVAKYGSWRGAARVSKYESMQVWPSMEVWGSKLKYPSMQVWPSMEVGGDKHAWVRPTCGVKQGCPLSPPFYLNDISDVSEGFEGACIETPISMFRIFCTPMTCATQLTPQMICRPCFTG